MNEIINGTYQLEEARTLDVIASEIKIIEKQTSQAVLAGAIEIGKRLSEAKEQIEHGEWENWCSEHLNYSRHWASKLIKISEEYGDENSAYFKAISNVNTSSHLSISNALRLLQVPENEVENFVEEHDVSEMKVKELEDEIKRLKEELDSKELEKEDNTASFAIEHEAYTEAEELKAKLQAAEKEIEELKNNVAEGNTKTEGKTLKAELQAAKAEEALEKAEKQVQKLKEQLKEAEEKKEAEIKERIAGAKKTIEEDAKRDAQRELNEAHAENERLQKQLAQNSNEAIAVHKVKMGNIKDTYTDVLANIDKMPNEDRERIRAGFKKFMQTLTDAI